jgi:hypothetical protein
MSREIITHARTPIPMGETKLLDRETVKRIQHFKDWGDPKDIGKCPKCGIEALRSEHVRAIHDEIVYICPSCGFIKIKTADEVKV